MTVAAAVQACSVLPFYTGVRLQSEAVSDIVERIRSGDVEAFGHIYVNNLRMISKYISARVPDQGMVEDLTSETFFRALRGMTGFVSRGVGIEGWLITIARNLVTDYQKAPRQMWEVLVAGFHELENQGPDLEGFISDGADRSIAHMLASPSAEDSVIAAQQDWEVHVAVTRLIPRQRACLELRYFRHFTIAQTASIMGVSEPAVKMLHTRAVRSLESEIPISLQGG